jgi:uncharacterized protein (TIGR00725 family)
VTANVAVIGPGQADAALTALAERVGREIALSGATLVCGGLGGVMAAACRGAAGAGGLTVGILPGTRRDEANPWVKVAVPTGLGEHRNALVVRASDVVIAIGGEYGTLSEIAMALKTGVPVVGVTTWSLERPDGTPDRGIVAVAVEEAVPTALALAASRAEDTDRP